MKESTQKILDQIDEAHDWQDGQVYGSGGTRLSSTDTCLVCSLRRHWLSDSQNNIEGHHRFSDGETGDDLSMRQANQRGCE